MKAQDFTATHGDAEFDSVCANVESLGYAYWFTQDSVTYYRHPVTQHIAEIVCH